MQDTPLTTADLARLRAPRVQPDGTILLYPDELGLEEGPRFGDLRLIDLIAEMRANDPTWADSVARANAYKRKQDNYYRRRTREERLQLLADAIRQAADIVECTCGVRVKRYADGRKIDWSSGPNAGGVHVCNGVPGQLLAEPAPKRIGAQPVRTFASDWQTNPKRLPAPSKPQPGGPITRLGKLDDGVR